VGGWRPASPAGRVARGRRRGTWRRALTASAIQRAPMRVYLVPVGIERYALYCEVHDDPGEAEGRPRGFLRRWFGEFLEAIRQAEPGRRRRPRASEPASSSRFRRAWRWGLRRLMRWVAASVAEQRLLWHLRRQSTSHLTHPDDLAPDAAEQIMRRILQRDADRHLFWLAFDAVGLTISGILAIIPGPNVLAYYFAFRVVGHYLSRRGARQGLHRVEWRFDASPPLAQLRQALALGPSERRRLVRDVSSALSLERLTWFVERTARST
tara:strand:+ start:649 stop:1449 length:801 start_codon:yes stop_codon:yes gene_type:complete